MAKEWYLLKSPNSLLSGFEEEALNDFGEESFLEVLETDLASDIEIYNYDLSVATPARVVIQGRTQDTKLNSISRQMLAPIGLCKKGCYVKYKDRFWLIVGLVDDNSVMYEKAVLALCNWKMAWINRNGEIVERWISASSASQYNNGETGMQFYFVRSDQLLISLPDDDECLLLADGCRFIIDKRCKIYERDIPSSTLTDTSFDVITYQLTRSDTVLYNYGEGGHMEFIATQDEQHEHDGFYRIDDKGYWLCDKPQINDKRQVLSSSIISESNEIYCGIEESIFTAEFYDANGNAVGVFPTWSIKCDFAPRLDIRYVGNSIMIATNDNSLINKSFELLLDGLGYPTTSITVTIKSFF